MKTLARIPVAATLALTVVVVQLLLVRPAIERAFAGASFSWLNAWAAGAGRSADRWLSRLDWALVGVVLVLLIPALARWLVEQRWMQRRVGLASPGEIGVLRAGVCALALHQVLGESMVGLSSLAPELRHSMGVIRLFRLLPEWVQSATYSGLGLALLHGATVIALVLGMVGLWTRRALVIAFVLTLFCGGLWREVTHFFHSGVVPLYLLGVLALVDCGAGFSLDYYRRARAGCRPRFRYRDFQAQAWVRWSLWVTVALPYLFAGLCKLRESGFAWADPANIAGILLRDSLNLPDVDLGLQPLLREVPDGLLLVAGALTLLGELGFLLVSISASARFAFPAVMLGMHLGTLLFQGFTFWDSLFLDGALCVLAVAWPFGVRRARHDRVRRFIAFFERRLPDVSGRTAGGVSSASRVEDGGSSGPPPLFVLWIAAQFFVWALRLDFYPVTQWRMYAERRSDGIIHYWTVATRDQTGLPGGNFLKDCPRVYTRDARYRDLLSLIRDSGIPEPVREAFRTCAAGYNARIVEPERKLAELRVQRWRWSFLPRRNEALQSPVRERDFTLAIRAVPHTLLDPPRAGLDVQ